MALCHGQHCGGSKRLHYCILQCHERHQSISASLLYLISFDLLSTLLSLLTFLSCRSVKHYHVKANLPTKLLCIWTFGNMELSKFKEIILSADYEICKETKKSCPTWYHLTVDIFVKFLYKVTIPSYNLYDIIFKSFVLYIVVLVLKKEISIAVDAMARQYRETTPVAEQKAIEIWDVIVQDPGEDDQVVSSKELQKIHLYRQS